MDGPALLTFALASLLVELTPGPNMAWLAIVAVTEGRNQGLSAVAGVALGLAIIGVLAALGLGTAVAASPTLYEGLRWAGILWLLWLAYDGWRSAEDAMEEVPAGWGLERYFRRGLVTNLLNPKAAIFYIAVLPGFTTLAAPILPQVLTLTLVFVVVATSVHAAIVLLADRARVFLTRPEQVRVVRRVLSVALALVAVWFWWETAR